MDFEGHFELFDGFVGGRYGVLARRYILCWGVVSEIGGMIGLLEVNDVANRVRAAASGGIGWVRG